MTEQTIVTDQPSVDTLISSKDDPRQPNASESDKDIPKERPLTPKEWLLIECYLSNGGNQKQATIDAGYKCKSDGGYRALSTKLFRKPNVARALYKRREEVKARIRANTEISAGEILDEVIQLARLASKPGAIVIHGKTIVTYQPHAAARCWELVGGQTHNMFTIKTADMSDTVKEREKQLDVVKQAYAVLKREKERQEEEAT